MPPIAVAAASSAAPAAADRTAAAAISALAAPSAADVAYSSRPSPISVSPSAASRLARCSAPWATTAPSVARLSASTARTRSWVARAGEKRGERWLPDALEQLRGYMHLASDACKLHATPKLVAAEGCGDFPAGGDLFGHREGSSPLGRVARPSLSGSIAEGRIRGCGGGLVLSAGHVGGTLGCLDHGGRCRTVGCGRLLRTNVGCGIGRGRSLGLPSRHLVLLVATRRGCCGSRSPHSAVRIAEVSDGVFLGEPGRGPRSARSGRTPRGIAVDVRSGGHTHPSPPRKSSGPDRWLGGVPHYELS